MSRIYYNKLIRDKIKDKIEDKDEECEVRVIDDEHEFQQELFKKVREESQALAHADSREAFLHGYADLMIVLDALTHALEFSEAEIKTAIEENLERKGGFEKRHFLHWSEDLGYKSDETPQGIRE